MFRGDRVLLRALTKDDIVTLHRLHEDVETEVGAIATPWLPQTVEQAVAAYEKREPDADKVDFAVESLSGELLGCGLVWGIDAFNRNGHLGFSLLPEARGRGYAPEALRLLCDYAFRIRGLHRLGLETLVTNTAMIAAAEKAGFQREGTLREHAWVAGSFADVAVFGLLAAEFAG
ncbi:RimJ/RimL family protein N-acetyltransferase [Streptosporangium becharense]|uniref:RimJ/RimL family protein N-acetyltransferase n=1 Tax=Streptosporangium becharense TaxID=1816182 RepID=A0A7W9IK93_9ACTN|nr:GNAT family protein [Streptosporangium becharense]MBB2911116.1 RimJ/RimL family protein N-acetyltransferase [Streptosporangium becharense]MBB5821826.1 RimJ/RimL family protein N-acetyltransferase [Streptosporangium becharense]